MDYTYLAQACADVAPQLPAAALEHMLKHWELVQRWNARINLTSIASGEPAAWLHYRDSLEGLAYLHGPPVVDIGSGAGFPGLILAMARPRWSIHLLEPRRKRASFLRLAIDRLNLGQVEVIEGRLQDNPAQQYAHAVTRATFSSDAQLGAAARWLCDGGTLLAYRGAAAPRAPNVPSHVYHLREQARRIDIWSKAALAALCLKADQ